MLSQNPQAMPQSSPAISSSTPEQHLRAQLELLQNHETGAASASGLSSAREPRASPTRPPNGYEALPSISQDITRSILSKLDAEAHIHPDLRAQVGLATTPNMMPMAPPSGHSPGTNNAGPSAAALAPAPPQSQMILDDPTGSDGRKAKRELSQSKRAAQNRAAQRAFRQRKEGYIKKLEQQVRDFAELEHSYKAMQSENYALREYVIHLQSRLLDTQGEFPPPPPNVNLSQPPSAPTSAPAPPASAPEQAPPPSSSGVGTPLEAVAQAVAGLAAQEQMAERQQSYPSPPFKSEQQAPSSQQQGQQQGEQDTRTTDEINRQLNAEERANIPA